MPDASSGRRVDEMEAGHIRKRTLRARLHPRTHEAHTGVPRRIGRQMMRRDQRERRPAREDRHLSIHGQDHRGVTRGVKAPRSRAAGHEPTRIGGGRIGEHATGRQIIPSFRVLAADDAVRTGRPGIQLALPSKLPAVTDE